MNELDSDARELLSRLADADGPSDAQLARMKRRLGVALGAAGGALAVAGAAGAVKAAGAAGAAGAGTKVGGLSLGGLLSVFALGAAAGVGVSASSVAVRRYFEPPAPATSVASAAVRAPNGSGAATPEPALPAPPVDVPADEVPEVAAEIPVERARAAASAVEPTLGPEVELVIAAKRELTLGRAPQALALVERLAREFPNGALREERKLLEVLSLCAMGRVEAARRQARDFAAASPRSPLLPRLEQSCGGGALPDAER